jgi:hypothetical protein
LFFAEHRLEFVDEVGDVFEVAVDAGEADVSDLVDQSQVPHYDLTDTSAFDFSIELGQDFGFDRGDNALDAFSGDRAFPAGFIEPATDLLAVERFAHAILLDDLQRHFGDSFVGGESPLAREAFTPTPNGDTVFAGPRIDDAIVILPAKRTSHEINVEATPNGGSRDTFATIIAASDKKPTTTILNGEEKRIG